MKTMKAKLTVYGEGNGKHFDCYETEIPVEVALSLVVDDHILFSDNTEEGAGAKVWRRVIDFSTNTVFVVCVAE